MINPESRLFRLWQYQKERFPVLAHGGLILALSFSALCFSILLRGQRHWPAWEAVVVAFISAFCFFLQLRIADEFKDFEEDSRYRPYRAVPRGLVSLRELWGLGVFCAGFQLLLALWLDPKLLGLLALGWGYMGLMRYEFFAPKWLKARPLLYTVSHMFIVPLIDLYITACDWLVVGAHIRHIDMIWFLMLGFSSGFIIELSRKIRAPQDEEVGVETYSALWGYHRATLVWLSTLLATAACVWVNVRTINAPGGIFAIIAALLVIAGFIVWRFWQNPVTKRARRIEALSGLWTLLVYLSVGVLPLFFLI